MNLGAFFAPKLGNVFQNISPPFAGRGAISFAMNVAEILRALELLDKYQY